MRKAVNRMWTSFGAAVNSTLAEYLGLHHGAAGHEQSEHTQDKPDILDSQFQRTFVAPGPLGSTGNNDNDPFDRVTGLNPQEPFLIDFVQLDNRPEFISFAMNDDMQGTVPFRTQVRIRTNDDPISHVWNVSFSVLPGQVVQSTSRGSFEQHGHRVTVNSIPEKETKQSMVVRFVIEGVTRRALHSFEDDENQQQQQQEGWQDILQAASLPDPTSATFQTGAY